LKGLILAGGSGVRLFPLSRKNLPKQFLKIGSDRSFFQGTVERVLKLVKEARDVVITSNEEHYFHLKYQLKELGLSPEDFHFVKEPLSRNTASAIALTVKYLLEVAGVSLEERLFVSPSDHLISPVDKLVEKVMEAEKVAKEGFIVTFGIRPTKPETGYGYIEAGEIFDGGYKVNAFHEKPSLEKAKEYLAKGNFFWNSGMFLFSIETILEEFKEHCAEIFELFEGNDFESLLKNFEKMPNISIDYAIMEKTKRAVVIPLDVTWSDIGSWDSLYEILPKDERNNAKVGKVLDIDTENCLFIGNKRLISAIGLKDLMAIETDDVILLAKRGEGQRVKELVEKLQGRKDLTEITRLHTTVFRPWGSYTELERGERYRIKRVTVYPGESLSFQMHYHRSEHWVVVRGTAKVILEEDGLLKEYFLHENESIFVPKTTKHRLMNPGKIPLEIIEIQVGEYVEEDDIVRFEDLYGR
jgi:mannose-1-phosphate guanylyltransferase/mannose-6-phosphate isomerase